MLLSIMLTLNMHTQNGYRPGSQKRSRREQSAEGKAYGIRACILYPGGMASHWGAWSSIARQAKPEQVPPVTKALPPAEVASLMVWMAAASPELVLNEVIISPLEEEGWP